MHSLLEWNMKNFLFFVPHAKALVILWSIVKEIMDLMFHDNLNGDKVQQKNGDQVQQKNLVNINNSPSQGLDKDHDEDVISTDSKVDKSPSIAIADFTISGKY